ncbi:MAG: ankyrin repeat domain-containing protein, partial [Pseudomonadota bacterium]|nr:ankyrin repeat domain-containing protein [Pseudomonadota bacterium]
MDFRGVIRGCTAVMVAAPVVEGKLTGEFMSNPDDSAAFLESAEGKAAKRMLFAFRIWCVVELHSALEFGVPIVIRAGKAARDSDKVTYNTDGAVEMLGNLAHMIDVEKAECAVQADYDREIKNVREGVGADTVNKRVAGVVLGGMASAEQDILEVDAAVCGEPEALRELPDDRVEGALHAAAAGGRLAAVEVLLARGVVDLSSAYYPLYVASRGGHLEVVQALLGAGAAVDLANNNGATPLYVASSGGHVEVVQALLGAGAAVDLAHNEGRTPLYMASQNG